MWLIAGLGNPGDKYKLTRHNIGFMALDSYLRAANAPSPREEHRALTWKMKIDGTEVLMAQPQTFMNLSGESVQSLMNFYKIPLENLIVVHDEIDQPFGQMRIHKNRGHAGHNGIRSISTLLGSPDYIRLRLGVGRSPNPQIPVHEHVLQKFSEDEFKSLPEFLIRSGDALESILFEGVQKASTRFNVDLGSNSTPARS